MGPNTGRDSDGSGLDQYWRRRALALAGLLGQQASSQAATSRAAQNSPLAPKPPHFKTKAKRVIFLFMQGATSQMDTWEYKPRLQAEDGKVGPGGGTLVASKFKFARQRSKLAGTIRGSYFVIKGEY